MRYDYVAESGQTVTLNGNGFTPQQSMMLEAMIDKHGLQMFLQVMSEICGEKAVHIAHDWQDAPLAKRWATLEGAIGVASTKAGGL